MQASKSTAHILIVDDAVENVEILFRILKRAKHEVSVARSGYEALEKIAEAPPDLILLDVMMPQGLDGFAVCERLKQSPETANIPVIFVTALSETRQIVRGLEVGAVDVITKPFHPREVIARVNTHLTLLRQKQEIAQLRERDLSYFEKLSTMKDEVMQMTSHDLKNPLNNVKTALALLRRHGSIEDERGKEYLDILEMSADQMQSLIGSILDLARIETGMALNREQTQLNPFLQKVHASFHFPAQDKRIELSFEALQDDVMVELDPERMDQVLHNLLSNAIKYTDTGGSVTLSATASGETVRIIVADTGMGIPEDDVPHLFEKFFRVQSESHLEAEGTGLGLSIVKSIVEQHDGEIHVTSVYGEGSTFTVELPVYVPPEDEDDDDV